MKEVLIFCPLCHEYVPASPSTGTMYVNVRNRVTGTDELREVPIAFRLDDHPAISGKVLIGRCNGSRIPRADAPPLPPLTRRRRHNLLTF